MGTRLGASDQLIQKVPTADLLSDTPGRTDEDELGMTYANIDAYLTGETIPEEARQKLEETYKRSEHKRRLPVRPSDTWWQE